MPPPSLIPGVLGRSQQDQKPLRVIARGQRLSRQRSRWSVTGSPRNGIPDHSTDVALALVRNPWLLEQPTSGRDYRRPMTSVVMVSGRRRLAVIGVALLSMAALAGCQYAKGSVGTASGDFTFGAGVSFQAASQNGYGFGNAEYDQSQRVYGSPLPVSARNSFVGEATCVAVSGRRATIVFRTDLAKSTVQFGGPPAVGYLIQVQQATPADTQYLWSAQPDTGDLTKCTPPTDADVTGMVADNQGGTFTVGTQPPADQP